MDEWVAIVPAAGRGRRMGTDEPKLLLPLVDRPVLAWSLAVLDAHPRVVQVVVVVPPGAAETFRAALDRGPRLEKVKLLDRGGEERQASVAAGLDYVGSVPQLVLVHDGARPLVTPPLLERVARRAASESAAIPLVPVTDTLKEVEAGSVRGTPDRRRFRLAQTPQGFWTDLLRFAYERARADGVLASDDAALVERLGHRVATVEGDEENLKLTTPLDLVIAEAIIRRRADRLARSAG